MAYLRVCDNLFNKSQCQVYVLTYTPALCCFTLLLNVSSMAGLQLCKTVNAHLNLLDSSRTSSLNESPICTVPNHLPHALVSTIHRATTITVNVDTSNKTFIKQ